MLTGFLEWKHPRASSAFDLRSRPGLPLDERTPHLLTILAGVSEVAALEALRANAKAVELLTARRWYVIKTAREAGATWAQIGEALRITKQAAHDLYRRKIEEQEKYLPDPHDVAAARAVLEEVKED